MNMVSLNGYSPPQKLHPLSLLAQSTSRKTTGCLRVSSSTTTWFIYLDQGELIYATSSVDPIERLDRYLRQFSRQVPALVSAVRVQVRLLFETAHSNVSTFNPDYRAICWLVDQQYLTVEQATALIRELASEVLESFLSINEGNYEIVSQERFEQWVKLCQIDLRPLVEECQNRLRQPQPLNKPVAFPLSRSTAPVTAKPPSMAPSTLTDQISSTTVAPLQAARSKAKLDAEKPVKEKYTIVCIDDSPTVLHAIKAFLDDMSFTVVMVNDPVRALMQVIRSKPDLILLDVGMPNLDGYELCALLRRNQAFKLIPIIMVTGHTGFIDRAKAKLAGASGYLTKPFTQAELLKMVFKHLT